MIEKTKRIYARWLKIQEVDQTMLRKYIVLEQYIKITREDLNRACEHELSENEDDFIGFIPRMTTLFRKTIVEMLVMNMVAIVFKWHSYGDTSKAKNNSLCWYIITYFSRKLPFRLFDDFFLAHYQNKTKSIPTINRCLVINEIDNDVRLIPSYGLISYNK